MANVTVDKIVNHDLYANGNVSAFDSSLKTVVATFSAGQRIGNIYSWIERNGQLYYLIYLSKSDYDNFNPSFVMHDPSKLSVPDLPNILQQIADQKRAAEIEKKGLIPYYVETYLPYIIGAVVIAIALPTIVKTIKK
jgi:hypothetical protein